LGAGDYRKSGEQCECGGARQAIVQDEDRFAVVPGSLADIRLMLFSYGFHGCLRSVRVRFSGELSQWLF